MVGFRKPLIDKNLQIKRGTLYHNCAAVFLLQQQQKNNYKVIGAGMAMAYVQLFWNSKITQPFLKVKYPLKGIFIAGKPKSNTAAMPYNNLPAAVPYKLSIQTAVPAPQYPLLSLMTPALERRHPLTVIKRLMLAVKTPMLWLQHPLLAMKKPVFAWQTLLLLLTPE